MHEILFRGKRADNGEWVEGNLNIDPDLKTALIWWFDYSSSEDGMERLEKDESVDPSTVGQFTGLTDKNGRKIFEGDIVSGIAYSSENIGEIVWTDKIAAFRVRYRCREDPTAWENSSIRKAVSYGKKNEYAAKIIGNIHDNPELLEVSE